MKELKFFQKYKLKYTNRLAYNKYKHQLKQYEQEKRFENAVLPKMDIPVKDIYTFKHSGNSGDIIYSIPTMLGLVGNAHCKLFLRLNQSRDLEKHVVHPLGNIMLNTEIVEMLRPLLLYQPYMEDVIEYTNQPIDYDLDKFREYPLEFEKGNIARWNMLVYPVAFDLSSTWIKAPKETGLEDAILIARSFRYNAPGIRYHFLNKYPNVYFVGVQEEFNQMKEQITYLKYLPVKNFLQLAGYVASAKLFIGNQSFPFSVAEAMKVNRLLELYYLSPNVNVYGTNGFDFCFQPQFEYLVKKRYEEL